VAPGDATVRFGGSSARPRVYSISGDQGVLRVSDLDSGACQQVAISVFPGGNDLGDPVESQGRVFVPNFTTGTVVVVDVAHGHVTETPDAIAGGHFELFDRDGIVFYNHPDSDQAGVIRLDGKVTAVAKYNPHDPSEDVINAPHPPGASEPAGPSDPDEGAPPPSPTDPGALPPTGALPSTDPGALPPTHPGALPPSHPGALPPTDPGALPPPPPPSTAPVPGNPRGPDAPPTTIDKTRPALPGEPVPDPGPPTPPAGTSTSTPIDPTDPSSTISSTTSSSTSTTTAPVPEPPTPPDPGPPPPDPGPRPRTLDLRRPRRTPGRSPRRPTPKGPNCRSEAKAPARTSTSWRSPSPTGAIPAES